MSTSTSLSSGGNDIEAAIVQALERIGFSELRPKQKLAVRSFVEGNDVFVSLKFPLVAESLCATGFYLGCLKPFGKELAPL